MDVIIQLPIPIEIVYLIASYDRILSIRKIPKNDERYSILQKIPKKIFLYDIISKHFIGFKIYFNNNMGLVRFIHKFNIETWYYESKIFYVGDNYDIATNKHL
uniref:Uncharacterized protein n=1 Tax=viral metagenome TaxID=1070528 RepID=A0A6C0HTP1_9ZZZZ